MGLQLHNVIKRSRTSVWSLGIVALSKHFSLHGQTKE